MQLRNESHVTGQCFSAHFWCWCSSIVLFYRFVCHEVPKMQPYKWFNFKEKDIQGQRVFNVLTHDSRGVAVHLFRLRSRWLRYTLFFDRYSVHSHTGTDQGHKGGSLRGDNGWWI